MIQEEVTVKVGGAIQPLDQVKKKYQEIEAATKNATKAAKDHQKEIEKAARERGKAVGKVGSAAGMGVLGKMGEASGLGGGLGAFAAGAAIIGSAFKTLDQVVGELTERVRGNIAAQRGMQDAVQAAKDKRQSDALAQVQSDDQARRKLSFSGGSASVAWARKFADRGGVSRQDAMAAMTSAQDLDSGAQRDALEAAYRVARTGMMSMADAIQKIKGDQVLTHLAKNGNTEETAATILAGSSSPAAVHDATFRLRRFEKDLATDQEMQKRDQIQGNGNRAQEVVGSRLDDALVASMKRLGEVVDPVGKAVLDFNNGLQREIEMQQKLIDQMGVLATAWDKLTGNKEALRLTRLQLQAGAAAEAVPVRGSTP